VINQGTLDANNIQINDYIPAGLKLSDLRWRQSGEVATLRAPIAHLGVGKRISVDIIFTIDATLDSTCIVNNAEIKSASNILGIADADSIPNSENGSTPDPDDNDISDTTGGDDYDPAMIYVTCACHKPTVCPSSLTLNVSNITANSAKLKWNYSANSDGFEIYSNGQFITYVNANTNSYKLTGLKGKTKYTVKVITVLGSDAKATAVFTTGDDFGWLPAVYHMLN